MPDVQEAVRIFQDKRTILSVDDDSVNQTVIQTLFEGDGYTVIPASNGMIGLEKLDEMRGNPPDLILMDVSMPDMDGLTATRVLRTIPELAHIPIVAMTANAMHGDRERTLEAGCNGYIAKPIDVDKLPDEIWNYLRSRQQ